MDASEFEDLREAMGKLRLNDASFTYEMETSAAWALASAAASSGCLHLEIIRERIEREFNVEIITTAPSVIYKINLRDGTHDGHAQPGGHAGCVAHPQYGRALD